MEKTHIKDRLNALHAKTAPERALCAGATPKNAAVENENFAELSKYVYSEIVSSDSL